jgi:hypothetical protein
LPCGPRRISGGLQCAPAEGWRGPFERFHTHDPIPRVAPWESCDAPPPHPNTAHLHTPTRHAPPHPRPHSQGCTLGWYALTLWVKPNPVPLAAQPRPRLRVAARGGPSRVQAPTGRHVSTQGNALGFMPPPPPNTARASTPQHGAPPHPNTARASTPTTRFPGLHPGLVCVDPLGQTEPGSQGCTLGWYALTSTTRSSGLHPRLVCVDPLGQTEPGARGSSASAAVGR